MKKVIEVYWHGHCRLALVKRGKIVRFLKAIAIGFALVGCAHRANIDRSKIDGCKLMFDAPDCDTGNK